MHPKCGASLTTWVLLMFVMLMCTSAMAGFVEIPANVTAGLGTATPPCRCRHASSDVLITWRVNGLEIGRFPDIRPGSVNEDGNIVSTLTIPAEPQYNGTVVECVAVLFDGSPNEVSPPATILFTLAVSLPETTHFEISPSPLTVAVEQGTATFQCQHPQAAVIGWRVNGLPLNVATLQNVSVFSAGTPNGVTTTLSISTLLVYNETTIECIATFIDGSSPQFTPLVTLLIQDTPKQVENTTCLRDYFEDKLMTFWNPLPTLDINDTDPDILYTVELYQITCGQNILINRTEVAGSNVTEEGLDLMQIYKAVIAARNNVSEARNGPSVEMKETFMSLNGPPLLKLTRNFQINIQSGDPVPSYYEMILDSLDGHEDLVTNITVERNGEMIAMHVEESIPPNSLWRASILAYGCESHRIVTNYELSTHDIQNVVASSQLPGQISVTGELISGATATGVLVVVYSLTNSEDIHYLAKQPEGNSIGLDVTGLTGAEYGVSTFALENGLPLPSVIASPKNIAVLNGNQDGAQEQAPLIEYELAATNSSHVYITCTFLDSSITDCVAVVHQRISQLSSSGLMNIESSHKFTRSGDTAYGCIEGVNLEQYQVGVIGGKMITTEPKSNNRESIITGATVGVLGGVVVAVVVTVAVIMAVVACARLKRRRKTAAQPVYSEVTPRLGSQTRTIANIESGSRAAIENHYAESAGLPERPPEEQPLLTDTPPLTPRVEDDGGSISPDVFTPHVHASASEEDPPPLPTRLVDDSVPFTSDNGAGDPTYASVLAKTPNAVQVFCVSADSGSHTLPTADSGAGKSTERPAEEHPPPLLPRLMDDGASTPPLSESADQSTPQVTSDNGDPTYTPILTTTPHAVSQPAATEKVSYEDIQKYQNEQGQHYALPQLKITSTKWPVDDLHQVVYTMVKPPSITQTVDQNINCTSDWPVTPPPIPSHETSTVAVCKPITTNQLFSFLRPHASKWQSLGLALSLDEDRLDEIYTNNEREEDCLQELLELYMMRSDLSHSWEEVHAALEKIESSTAGSPTSVQETTSSKNSPMISGKTVLVPDMDDAGADSDHVDKQPPEESSDHEEQEVGSSDSDYGSDGMESSNSSVVIEMEVNKQATVAKEESSDSEEQEENSESGYSGRQQSESESSDDCVMQDDSTKLSQASSEDKNRPALNLNSSLSENLEDHEYESALDPPSGTQARITDNGNSENRTTEEELPMSCSSADQSCLQFHKNPDDQRNDDELCKISHWLCQDSHTHTNYNEAMIRQMGLEVYQRVRDTVDNNIVEESALVHAGHERLHKQVQTPSRLSDKKQFNPRIKSCIPMTCTALAIPEVHKLFPLCLLKEPKHSISLVYLTIQVDRYNDHSVTLLFTYVILFVAYIATRPNCVCNDQFVPCESVCSLYCIIFIIFVSNHQ